MGKKVSFGQALADVFQHPARLLPTVFISLFWLVISMLSAFRVQIPVLHVLATLTYANAGLYGGALGAVGGIFGKAFVACFINMLIVSAVQGKNPFSHMFAGVRTAFGRSALNGAQAGASVVTGVGAGMLLYALFNVTGTTTNCAVAVIGAIAAFHAAGTLNGFLFSILFFIAGKLSGGRTPSRVLVSRILTGASLGFAATLPMTILRPHRILLSVAAGAAIFLVGVIVLIIGNTMTKRVAAAIFAAALVASVLLPGYAVVVYASEDEDDGELEFTWQTEDGTTHSMYFDEDTGELDGYWNEAEDPHHVWDANKHVYYDKTTGLVVDDYSHGKYPVGYNIYTGEYPGGGGTSNDTSGASSGNDSTPAQDAEEADSTGGNAGTQSGGNAGVGSGGSSGSNATNGGNAAQGAGQAAGEDEDEAAEEEQPEEAVEMIDISEAGGNPYADMEPEEEDEDEDDSEEWQAMEKIVEEEAEPAAEGELATDEEDMPESEAVAGAVAGGVAAAGAVGSAAAAAAGSAASSAVGQTLAEAGAEAASKALAETGKYILPDSWKIDNDGSISFRDPVTGENKTYYSSDETDENGNPVWRSEETDGAYNITDIYSNYVYRDENADVLKQDYATAQANRAATDKEFQSGEKSALTKQLEQEKHTLEENLRKQEAIENKRSDMMIKRGVANEDDFKKAVMKERQQEYEKQQDYVADEAFADMGYQAAKGIRDGSTVIVETLAEAEPTGVGKVIRDGYAAARNTAENFSEVMCGTKSVKDAVTDAVVDSAADVAKYHIPGGAKGGYYAKGIGYTAIDTARNTAKSALSGKTSSEVGKSAMEGTAKGVSDALIEEGTDVLLGSGPTSTFVSGALKWISDTKREAG